MKKLAGRYPTCEIHVFDPAHNATEAAGAFDMNRFNFKQFDVGGNMSLKDAMTAVGHTDKHITLLRSDCDGCEWEWVYKAQKEDPSIFLRIDQMSLGIQMHKPDGDLAGNDSKTKKHQTWTDGMPKQSRVDSMHEMLSKSFNVISSNVQPNAKDAKGEVPAGLQQQGVLASPGFRHMNLINQLGSEKPAASLLKRNKQDLEHTAMPATVANLFFGLRGTCEGETSTVGDIKYCPNLLKDAEKNGTCMAYIFGASTDRELRFIRNLRHDHSTCYLQVFDPKTSMEKVTEELNVDANATAADKDPFFFFRPWGIWAGEDHRVVHQDNGNRGELYTLHEIWNLWEPPAAWKGDDTPKVASPNKITLFKGDFANVPRTVWEKELTTDSWIWWGSAGLQHVAQMA